MKLQNVFLFVFLLGLAPLAKSEELTDLTGVDFQSGNKFDFSQYNGKVIYLDFWASWCAPCLKSLPFIEKLYQTYSSKGFEVIAINIDELKPDAVEFLTKHPISYTNLYDPTGRIGKKMKVRYMPTSFLIDKHGNILFKHVGFDDDFAKLLEQTIKKLVDN